MIKTLNIWKSMIVIIIKIATLGFLQPQPGNGSPSTPTGQGASKPGTPWSPLSPLSPLRPRFPIGPCITFAFYLNSVSLYKNKI